MSRTLIMIHGMGKPAESWHEKPWTTLLEAAEPLGLKGRLEAEVTPYPIRYDTVFRDVLEGWDESAEALQELMLEKGAEGTQVVDWLAKVEDEDGEETNFFWSHAVDVLLYRFFPQVMQQVRTRVMREIAAVQESGGASGRTHILAYSLGTAVTHDALAYLGTKPLDGSHAYTVGEIHGKIESLFTVANVSRVLQRHEFGVYTSCVHPQSFNPERAYLGAYLNFRHGLDPIPAVRMLKPAGWGNRYMEVCGTEIEHLLDFNTHDLVHYLRHPNVHVPILSRILNEPISAQDHESALERFAAEDAPPCLDRVEQVRTRLRQMVDLVRDQEDPLQLIKVAAQSLAVAKEAWDDCS